MVVVTSRQTGLRPETIRTRLARFMPTRTATGWSIVWSAQTERPEEIADEDELRAADHLGCYSSAVAHALAQAEVAPTRLRVTAESVATSDGSPQPITVEIRAQIPGPALDQTIFEAIARRADPNCPVWKSLAAEVGVKVIAILDDSAATETAQPNQADTSTTPAAGARQPSAQTHTSKAMPAMPSGLSMSQVQLPRLALPRWLTPRMAALMAVALGVFAVAPHPWLG